jgi:hypothetical protein
VTVINVAGIVRTAIAPVEAGLGHYQSPLAIKFFSEHGADTPERDACLALAYQQNGNLAEAERLYRNLPQFAMSWNNLGVLLKQQNKDSEASATFEKALQLDPNLHEAELNLHGKSSDMWTQYHQQFLPGTPMLAIPDKQMSSFAMSEFSGWNKLRILLGPLATTHAINDLAQMFHDFDKALPILLPRQAVLLALLQMAFAWIVLLAVPHYEVTQAPGKGFAIAQYLFPGMALSNPWIATPVFYLWSYLTVQLVMLKTIGSPYFMNFFGMPSLRGYELIGVDDALLQSAGLIQGHAGDWNTMLNPSWEMAYMLPAVLFLVHVIYLWRKRKSVSI